jgi:hypothetical protein
VLWKSSPTKAICLVEGVASAVAIHWSANPWRLRSSGRMQLHFALCGRTRSIRTSGARSLPVLLPPQRLPFASCTWDSVDARPARTLDQIFSTWASNAGFRKGGRPDRLSCLDPWLQARMPHTVITKIGPRSRVVRFVSLDAIPAIGRRGAGRICVRIVGVSGVIPSKIISQTTADQ